MLPPWVPSRTFSQFSSTVWPAIAKIYTHTYMYVYIRDVNDSVTFGYILYNVNVKR